MTTAFPTGLDNFTNPTPANNLSTPTVLHTDQHSNSNDAVEALEAKVGVDSSVVTSSLDYRVTQLENNLSIYVISKILNNSEIKSLQQSYITVVPAPIAGTYNAFIQAIISPDIVLGGEYGNITDGAYIVIGYENDLEISSFILDDSGNGANGLTRLLIDSAGGLPGSNTRVIIPNQRDISGWGLVAQYSIGDSNSRENKALQIIAQNNGMGDFDGGDDLNTLTVTIIYATIPL